jgi:hypothetical protein
MALSFQTTQTISLYSLSLLLSGLIVGDHEITPDNVNTVLGRFLSDMSLINFDRSMINSLSKFIAEEHSNSIGSKLRQHRADSDLFFYINREKLSEFGIFSLSLSSLRPVLAYSDDFVNATDSIRSQVDGSVLLKCWLLDKLDSNTKDKILKHYRVSFVLR